jgi:hypothetical protein
MVILVDYTLERKEEVGVFTSGAKKNRYVRAVTAN